MPASSVFERTGLHAKLDSINEEIAAVNRRAQVQWKAFEDARDTFAAGNGEQKSVEKKHTDYEQTATELKALEAKRNELFGLIAAKQPDKKSGTDRPAGSFLAHSALSNDGVLGRWPELKNRPTGATFGPEVKANLITSSGIGDAFTPQDQANFFFDRLAPMSVGLESGFTVLDTDDTSIKVPRFLTDGAGAWTAEDADLPTNSPTGDSVTVTPTKFGNVVILTKETLRDSSPPILAALETSLMRNIALGLDLGFFEGSGTPPAPTGLKNVSGIQEVSMGTNGAQITNLDPIADALGALSTENAQGTAIVMHPRTWIALAKARTLTSGSNEPLLNDPNVQTGSNGAVMRLLGVPVYLSSQLSITETQGSSSVASSIYVYDAPQVVAVRRQGVEVEVNPWYSTTKEEIAVRATTRWGLAVPNPKAVVRIKGVIA